MSRFCLIWRLLPGNSYRVRNLNQQKPKVYLNATMSSEEHLMFVYGTLKRDQPNNHFMLETDTGKAEFVSSGRTVHKYPLVIAGTFNIPYLLYVEGQGYNVQGDIYKVDLTKRNFMDDFESHPTYYERMQTDIIVDNSGSSEPKTLKCWAYFMKNFKPQMLELKPMPCYDNNDPNQPHYVERYKRDKSAFEEYKNA